MVVVVGEVVVEASLSCCAVFLAFALSAAATECGGRWLESASMRRGAGQGKTCGIPTTRKEARSVAENKETVERDRGCRWEGMARHAWSRTAGVREEEEEEEDDKLCWRDAEGAGMGERHVRR